MNLGRQRTFQTSIVRKGDATAPTVRITTGNGYPVPITITFSEEVFGFEIDHITISAGGSLANFTTSDNKIFALNWTLASGENTMNIASDVCQDLAGNNNYPAMQLVLMYTDIPVPDCKYFQENTPDATNINNAGLSLRGGVGLRRIGQIRADMTGVIGTIISATLSIYSKSVEIINQDITLNSILVANQTWTEYSTWNFPNIEGVRWAGDIGSDGGSDAGCSISGTDYNPTPLGSFSYSANTIVDTLHQVTLDVSQVQTWQTANHGFVLQTPTDNVIDFHSDDALEGLRPTIKIVYKPITEYTVTNLNDSGEGSLRYGLENRQSNISFSVTGTIVLSKSLRISSSVDLDGGGVCLRTNGGSFTPIIIANVENVTLTNLQVRPGPNTNGNPGDGVDGILLQDATNILIDHCSVSWAIDENISIWRSTGVIVQDCIISEGLYNSTHSGDPHSNGLLIADSQCEVVVRRCLFAHNDYRNPVSNGRSDVVNCVIYAPGFGATHYNDQYGVSHNNYIGNVLLFSSTQTPSAVNWVRSYGDDTVRVYKTDNTAEGLTESFTVRPGAAGMSTDIEHYLVAEPYDMLDSGTILPVEEVFESVLQNAGATPRGAIDTRIVQQVRDRSGGFIDDPAEVGGWA
jgi:hypothetical protein